MQVADVCSNAKHVPLVSALTHVCPSASYARCRLMTHMPTPLSPTQTTSTSSMTAWRSGSASDSSKEVPEGRPFKSGSGHQAFAFCFFPVCFVVSLILAVVVCPQFIHFIHNMSTP